MLLNKPTVRKLGNTLEQSALEVEEESSEDRRAPSIEFYNQAVAVALSSSYNPTQGVILSGCFSTHAFPRAEHHLLFVGRVSSMLTRIMTNTRPTMLGSAKAYRAQ